MNNSTYNLISLDIKYLPKPVKNYETDSFVELSGVKIHYRVYGKNKPALILIHGNGGSVNSLKAAAKYLANDYTVYLPESRCHGKSSFTERISYRLIADDIVEFAKKLNLEKPLIMGHSDGGIVALTIAAEYPDFPKAVISCGANSHPSELKFYYIYYVKFLNFFRKMNFRTMVLTEPDFTKEYLAKIICPTYLVMGEHDIMPCSDTEFIHSAIKQSEMAVVKDATHSSYMSSNGKYAYVLAKQWLDKIKE